MFLKNREINQFRIMIIRRKFIVTSSRVTMNFKYFTTSMKKKHFFNLTYNRNFFNLRNTIVTFLICNSRFFKKIKISFKYITQTISVKFFNILLT